MPARIDSSSTTVPAAVPLGCVAHAALFRDRLLETPPTGSAPIEERRRSAALASRAHAVCAACPVQAQCLYRAVVEHDVAGYVAGTTERQRAEIRRRLRVVVEPEDFDTLAGVSRAHRQIDHDEVVRLRRANPHESLERLAHRLGCSLSTVKRHLRQERKAPPAPLAAAPVRPSVSAVLTVAAQVVDGRPARRSAA